MSQRIGFGVFAPQGWKMELAPIEGAAAKWAKCRETALLAEELGYDSIWVYDHFHNIPRPAHEAVFECWTTMAALADATSRIRLGQMVSCNGYRQPSLAAKVSASIDVISGGRLDFGIGAGWYQQEFEAYGYEFPPAKDRIGIRPHALDDLDALAQHPDAVLRRRELVAVRLELLLVPAGADAEVEATAADHVEAGADLGGERRLAVAVAADHLPEPDA